MRRCFVAILLIITHLLTLAGDAAAGAVRADPTFGRRGVALINVPGEAYPFQIAAAPGNKTVVGADVGGRPAVLRLTGQGRLDRTFGDGGMKILQGTSYPIGLAVARDGSIVVGVHPDSRSSPLDVTLRLIRLRSDGTIDRRFADNGVAQIDDVGVVPLPSGGISLAIDSDGSIVVLAATAAGLGYYGGVAQPFLIRFRVSGARDRGFGVGGVAPAAAAFPAMWPVAVVIQRSGRIIVGGETFAGYTSDHVFFAYGRSGIPDRRFGIAGVVRHDVGGVEAVVGWDRMQGLVVAPDDKIVTFGGSPGAITSGQAAAPSITRLGRDGEPDRWFGKRGVVRMEVRNGVGDFTAAAPQGDGSVVAAAHVLQNGGWSAHLVRFGPTGALDDAFGSPALPFRYAEGVVIQGPRILSTGPMREGSRQIAIAAFR